MSSDPSLLEPSRDFLEEIFRDPTSSDDGFHEFMPVDDFLDDLFVGLGDASEAPQLSGGQHKGARKEAEPVGEP